ncbi:hypothetical protein J132_05148 [Termitomyces sp. J132]|nr:hypothetical protein J132_05148 [Termitomyces sp. J132]
MSSPSIPVVSPADLDEVVVYDSGGEEFERWRRTSVRDQSQSSMVVVVDFPGVLKGTKFCPALPKEGSMGWSAGKAGLSWGGWGKGASSAVIRGKRRASPPLGAGPSKRLHGRKPSAGPPESLLFSPTLGVPSEWLSSPPTPIPLIMEVFLRKQVEALMTSLAVREGELQRAREDHDMARTEKEAMEWKGTHQCMEGQPAGEAEGRGRVPEGDALWVELEAARWREDWLANKAALGCAGILRWVQEHQVLLDGASAVFALIQDGLSQGSVVQPPELQQGMV